MRRPLVEELVRRRLAADSREANQLVVDGRILVGGAPATNPRRQVGSEESIRLTKIASRFVGRGGEKLQGAIDRLSISFEGDRVLDVGASTGGFTDAVLCNGARSVVALDVGRGQLHERLRQDPRVEVMDRTNIRLVEPEALGSFDSVVGDLSFISLTAVIDVLTELAAPGGQLLLLVKPQFEAPREVSDKNSGVINDQAVWRGALERTLRSGIEHGLAPLGSCASPLRGADGNVEFFIHLRRPIQPADAPGHDSEVGVTTNIDQTLLIEDLVAHALSDVDRPLAGPADVERPELLGQSRVGQSRVGHSNDASIGHS